jgi:hypothetical protein
MPTPHSSDIPHIKQVKLLPITAGIICMALAFWAALWLWSSVLTVRPAKLIDQWQQKPAEFDQAIATSLLPRLKQSLAFNASDANSYLLMAGLYQLLAEDGGEVGDKPNNQQQDYFDLAELNYKKAIQQQPTWDYAWAKLALFYSNNYSKEKLAMQSLNQAMLLGPYENETQKKVILLIFKHWQNISQEPAQHTQALKIIRHAVKFNTHSHFTLDVAKKFNKLDELEPLLSQQRHKKRLTKYKKELAVKAKDTTAETGHE